MSEHTPSEPDKEQEYRFKHLEALKLFAVRSEKERYATFSPEDLQQGKEAEEQESQYLETHARKQQKREFKYKLFKDVLDGTLKLFWILFSLTLISYLFLFGWYIVLCHGAKHIMYINIWPVWHVTFEVSKIPFDGLSSEIITTYLATAIVQTFLFIGALQKLVIKEETWLDNIIKYIKEFGQFLQDRQDNNKPK